MRWNKRADWLPLSNAKAQVKFWKMDLKAAEDYLKKVKKYKKQFQNEKFYQKILKIAEDDVALSRRELDKALKKLEEAKKLEKIYS